MRWPRFAALVLVLVACEGKPPPANPTAGEGASSASGSGNAGGPGCPEAHKAGAACSDEGRGCDYPDGASCLCNRTRCVTAAGPIPDCTTSLVWECRADGCPMRLTGPCAREGQKCMDDDGLCAHNKACLNGKWTTVPGGPGCRPAAPPH